MKLKTKQMYEEIDGSQEGTWDGIIIILWEGEETKAKQIVLTADGTEYDRFISLNDCLKEIGYDGKGVVRVIIEDALEGYIYTYGNYGAKWYRTGTTVGYA